MEVGNDLCVIPENTFKYELIKQFVLSIGSYEEG